MWESGEQLPLIKSYNETTGVFEFKRIVNAWKREPRSLVKVTVHNGLEIICTPNHRFKTIKSTTNWKY